MGYETKASTEGNLSVGQCVGGTRFRTDRKATVIENQSSPRSTHPANLPPRVAHHECVSRQIVGHYGSRSDEGVLLKPYSTNNDGVCPYGHPLLKVGGLVFTAAINRRARVFHVRKNSRGPDENFVLAGNSTVKADVILHLASISKFDTRSDKNVLSELTISSDITIGHQMTKMPNLAVRTDLRSFVDDRRGVGKIFHVRKKLVSQAPLRGKALTGYSGDDSRFFSSPAKF